MWLVYLRFDDAGTVQTYHVTALNKADAYAVLQRAETRGLTPGATLVEYAIFYTRATVHRKEAPNFHFMNAGEFTARTGGWAAETAVAAT
jgi:hypothetical protein